MQAIGYIRVSTDEQVKGGVSLAAQEERIRAYASMAGLSLISVIREEGVSASLPLSQRPGGKELLGLLNEHSGRHVIALKLDRLFRDAEDALRQTRLWDRAGIALHMVDMGGTTVNTASAMGRLFLTMTAAFAELERNLISERTSAALAHKKRCLRTYSPTPYGYTRQGDQLVSLDVEQSIIAEIKQHRAAGRSLRAIAQHLNLSQVPTKAGGKWHASTVKYILGNALYRTETSIHCA